MRPLILATAVALTLPAGRATAAPKTAAPKKASPAAPQTPEPLRGWPEAVPRVAWWEWAGSGAILAGSLALRFGVDLSGDPNWEGGILFDEAGYDAFLIESPHLFNAWRDLGDVLYLGSFAWSALDPALAGLTNDWDTALQMTGMNLEAFAIYSMTITLAQLAVRRERPTTRICDDRAKAEALGISCGEGNANKNRSFVGGHVGTAATAATLTCLHHAELDLWGPQADVLPCVAWWLATGTVFASRTVTGQHYLTDNLIGLGLGPASALLPYFLHYGRAPAHPTPEPSAMPRPTTGFVLPTPNGVMIQLGGVL